MPIDQLLAAVRDRWAARGILNDSPASNSDIAAFEQRYGVVLPVDLRTYFTKLNGTAIGASGMEDENLLGFWHLDQVRTFAEELSPNADKIPEAGGVFVIADHSIWVYAFGIKLSADPGAPTPIVVDLGKPYHQVAPSFSAFLEGYLRGDSDMIYPDPKGPGSNSTVAVI